MSEGLGDKVQGKVDEVGGKAKQTVGSVTGDDEMRAEGHADEAKGKAEGFLGKLKEIAEDVVDTAKGAVDKVTHHDHTTDDTTKTN